MHSFSVRSMTVVVVVVAALAEVTWSLRPALSRWTRQAIHCQADDDACKMCSGSCNTVEESRLPECCEAYNTCCDQYFQACKKCSSVAAKDQYFPEYCCASFTDCCDLVTTFQTSVKPPEPVRKEPKIELKIPTVAAPKPTTFPGSVSPSAPITPVAAPFPSQHSPLPPLRASPPQTTSGVAGTDSRLRSGSRSQQRSQAPTRSQASHNRQRHGRVTSRGRVIP